MLAHLPPFLRFKIATFSTLGKTLAFLSVPGYFPRRGALLRKEVFPMRHFLRDVLAAWLAAVLAAVAVHFMNL